MSKDIILFVNAIRPATFEALQEFEQKTGRTFMPVVIVDKKIQDSVTERNGQRKHKERFLTLSANFDSAESIRRTLKPYIDHIFAVTSQYENSMLELKKILPYLPYLPTPSETSLVWSTEKKEMRSLLEAYDKSLVPQYMEVRDSSDKTIKAIESAMPYPLVVKPSGLEGSLLVSCAKNTGELRSTLKNTFRGIQDAYDVWVKRQIPAVLVEEFMVGDMYSIDTYIGIDGTCYHTPLVNVVTGRQVGFDDFFGYMRLTPTTLSSADVKLAQTATEKACRALGLRAITAHVELMRTAEGWKIIELGPRVGGYRHDIYSLSYGINHLMNDVVNRAGETPDIPDTTKSHTAIFNIYAHDEGTLEAIEGVDAVKKLPSFISLQQSIQVGERVYFAKHNGDPVFDIILSNKQQDQLAKDTKSLEQLLNLRVNAL